MQIAKRVITFFSFALSKDAGFQRCDMRGWKARSVALGEFHARERKGDCNICICAAAFLNIHLHIHSEHARIIKAVQYSSQHAVLQGGA